jgi:hypothetical protein
MKRIEIELPFMGFYASIHNDLIDQAVESHFQNDQGEMPEDLDIYNADIDWQAIQKEYAQDLVEVMAKDLDLDLKYSAMTSPEYYNFETDRLFCTIPLKQINKIRQEVEAYPKNEWCRVIKERFTSYDGFWSHYSNDCKHEEWTRSELDPCQYRVMIETWLEHNQIDWRDYYLEDVYSLSTIDEAINEVIKYNKQGAKK